MPIQPRATSYDTGVETFSRFFDTDSDEKMSPLSLFSKLARNEMGGFIYLKGDTVGGETLRFDNRRARLLNTASIVTLDDSMHDLTVEYDRQAVKNVVQARVYPKRVDDQVVVIYTGQAPFAINSGQSVTVVLPFRDPATARPISATEVVWPLVADTDFKFGANQGDFGELNGALGLAATIGGNSTKVTFTNNGTVPGWLNKLQLRGKGIYAFDPQTFEAKDTPSILKRGELVLTWDLEQHDNPANAEALAGFKLLEHKEPRKVPSSARFLANSSQARMLAFLQGEVSSRITLRETVTAVGGDFNINWVSFKIVDGKWIWCEWSLVPAYALPIWIIGVSRIEVNPVECVLVL
jgi:hypothetical protein